MALEVAQGTFSARTTTGSQSVTGLSFQPKCVIFQVSVLTAQGESSGVSWGHGCATGASNECAYSNSALYDDTTSEAYAAQYPNACICLMDSASTILLLADFTSFNSDGFTINVSTASGTAYLVSYIALGGSEASFELVNFYAPTSTGNSAVTTSFQPTGCIVFGSGERDADGNKSSEAQCSIGAGNSSSNMWVHSATIESSIGTADSYGGYLTTKIVDIRSGSSATIAMQADLVSFGATDVTLNWTTTSATARRQAVLVWNGIQSTIGVETCPTTVSTKQTTSQNGTPKAIVACSRTNTATGAQDDYRMTFGFGVSSSARSCVQAVDEDAALVMDNCTDIDTAAVMKMCQPNGASLTVLNEGDISAFASGSFTLNWPTVDGSARYFGYVTFADAAASAGGGPIFGGRALGAGRIFGGSAI